MPIRKGPKPILDHEEERQKKDMCCDGCMMLSTAVVALMLFGLLFYIILLPVSFIGRAQDFYPGPDWYFVATILSPVHIFLYIVTLLAVNRRWRLLLLPNILMQGVLAGGTIGYAFYLGVDKKIDSTLIALGHKESIENACRIVICVAYLIMKLWVFVILIKYYLYLVRSKNQPEQEGMLNQQDQQWSERPVKRSRAFGGEDEKPEVIMTYM